MLSFITKSKGMTENITEEQEWKRNHIKGGHANNGEVKDKNLGVRRKFKE